MRFDAISFRAAFRTLSNIYERAFGKISLLYFNHYLFRKKSVLYIYVYIYIYIKCKCIYIYIYIYLYIYIKCKCIYIYIKCKCIYIYLAGSRMSFWVHLFKGSKENNIILNKFLHQVQLQILMNIFEVRVGCQYFSSYWLFCYLVLSFSIFIFWYIYIYIYIYLIR